MLCLLSVLRGVPVPRAVKVLEQRDGLDEQTAGTMKEQCARVGSAEEGVTKDSMPAIASLAVVTKSGSSSTSQPVRMGALLPRQQKS